MWTWGLRLEIVGIRACTQMKARTKRERERKGGVSVGIENEASWESFALVYFRPLTLLYYWKPIECPWLADLLFGNPNALIAIDWRASSMFGLVSLRRRTANDTL